MRPGRPRRNNVREGIVFSQTAIMLRTGASINGRLFAQMAVSLDSNIVVQP
jgi:hypothetical protein